VRVLNNEATGKPCVTVCDKTWKQTLHVIFDIYLRSLAAVTDTGRDCDVRRELGPLDQRATFADVHLTSTRQHTTVLIDWRVYIIILLVSEKHPLCGFDWQTSYKFPTAFHALLSDVVRN